MKTIIHAPRRLKKHAKKRKDSSPLNDRCPCGRKFRAFTGDVVSSAGRPVWVCTSCLE